MQPWHIALEKDDDVKAVRKVLVDVWWVVHDRPGAGIVLYWTERTCLLDTFNVDEFFMDAGAATLKAGERGSVWNDTGLSEVADISEEGQQW